MARVLIPFSEPQGAQRAIAQLLAEPRDPRLSVHLFAAVEPRVSGRTRIHLTEAHAAAMVHDAARRWLQPLEAVLAAAGIPHTSEIAVGPPRASIRAATERADIDRVLLPPAAEGLFARRERGWIRDRSPHPVTLVA
jgi:hypothetical protein